MATSVAARGLDVKDLVHPWPIESLLDVNDLVQMLCSIYEIAVFHLIEVGRDLNLLSVLRLKIDEEDLTLLIVFNSYVCL